LSPTPDSIESRRIVVGGTRWYARAAGAAGRPPVVLVHGLGVSGRYMVPLLRRLGDGFRALAPDLPGFGRSSDPVEPLGLAAMADALAAWMAAEGLPRAAMVGNSLGCQVIAHLAERHPQRVDRAALVSPTMDPGARRAWQQIARLLLDVPRERWPLQPIATRDYLEAGMRRGLRTLDLGLEDPAAAHYRQLRVPSLVVHGERDPIVSAAWAERVSRLLPDGRLVTVPGAPHAVNFSEPDALGRILVPFLTEGGEPG
jgi:2-hydroxy-6-oxonona-2,4-dienedioate hydrolase